MIVKRILVIVLVNVLAATISLAAENSIGRSGMDGIQVACVQTGSSRDIKENARSIIDALESESKLGTRLVAFPELVLTSCVEKVIRELTQPQIDQAVKTICEACKKFDIYAIVGSAYTEKGKWYNGAYIISPQGKIIKRYAKLHAVMPQLFDDGNELAIFRIDDVPATIMICHDERYPEIFRIPVLAGAKIGIYISHESKTPEKRDNYRCQVIARAVESQIAVVHCNAPDSGAEEKTSHGHSRIIDEQGKVLAEATSEVNQAIRTVVHPRKLPNAYALRGAQTPSLQKFWAEGLRVLKEQNPEFFAKQPSK